MIAIRLLADSVPYRDALNVSAVSASTDEGAITRIEAEKHGTKAPAALL
jgi:hypothetical protein